MSARPPGRTGPVETGAHLTDGQAARLLRWQRRMRLALLASAALLAVAVALIVALPDGPWTRVVTGLLFVPLLATGLVIQLTGRCPRCGARIQMESGLALPARCRGCGAPFRDAAAQPAG